MDFYSFGVYKLSTFKLISNLPREEFKPRLPLYKAKSQYDL